jgi:hypothetical protein
MADQRYEYRVEPLSVSPDELRNDRFAFEDVLNDAAGDGWVLEEALRVDSSSFVFVFGRPVES